MKLVYAFALSGCAQLFGLDTTTATPDASPAASVHAEIMLERIGTTSIDTLDDPAITHDQVAFIVNDANGYHSVPAIAGSAGEWSAPIPDGNPIVDYTIDGQRHLAIVPARDFKLTYPTLGHPNPQPPPDSSVFDLAITVTSGLAGGGAEQLTLMTIGAWSQQGIADPPMPTSALGGELMYTPDTALGGPLAKITPADTVVVFRRRAVPGKGAPLDGVFQTTLDQTGTDTLTGSLDDTPVDKTVNVLIAPNPLATRYTAVRPAVGNLAMGWACIAAPGGKRGALTGPTLNDGGIVIGDTAIVMPYGNPFAALGWSELLFYNTYESRTVMLPSGQSIDFNAGLESIVQPSAGLMLDMPAGLPESISLDDTPLSTDNLAVTVDRSTYARITMVNDRTANTFVEAAVFELTTPDAMTVKATLVIDALAVDPTALVVPPDVFVAGHTYVIQAITHQGGWPMAATGDFETQAPPYYIGYSYSGVFTVNP